MGKNLMAELSVIIPYCNEFPQNIFTIQGIAQELYGLDFEILAVNNFCDEAAAQNREQDAGFEVMEASAKVNSWLKSLHYKDKLSHWQAKNYAVKHSSGRFLWFVDAHCVVARNAGRNMFEYYKETHEGLDGTIHLPLTYKILESRKLIYKLVTELDKGIVDYRFTGFPKETCSFEVPCMSTCGMMMTRDLYDEIGGWPTELGIYGGGENFVNFTLAVLGKSKYIFNDGCLFHHGAKRGYNWNYNDYHRNRTIATYIFGGQDLAERYIMNCKGDKKILETILKSVLNTCWGHRRFIMDKQVISIEDWIKKWQN
jgi:glycosyltransferase involved in cell wall biosynthesis